MGPKVREGAYLEWRGAQQLVVNWSEIVRLGHCSVVLRDGDLLARTVMCATRGEA